MQSCISCERDLIGQVPQSRILLWFIAEEALELVSKKDKKKLQELLQVHVQHIHRNGGTLGHRGLLANQAQTVPGFSASTGSDYDRKMISIIRMNIGRQVETLW